MYDGKMQALYLKPVQTGFPEDSDARLAVSTMKLESLCDTSCKTVKL